VNIQIIERLAHIFRSLGAGWVLWLLLALSVLSLAVMFERALYFSRNSFGNVDAVIAKLSIGDLQGALKLIGEHRGLEAAVLRAGAQAAPRGPDAVEEIVLATTVRERLRYERFLSYLATLGNNAPFIGLFGTVLGIIEAFAALAVNAQAGAVTEGAADIMSGVSEALVATAVGLMVALPAVVANNAFGRWLKTILARGECLGHALASHLKTIAPEPSPASEARVPTGPAAEA
jgi:biopolymer transport protein ExbB